MGVFGTWDERRIEYVFVPVFLVRLFGGLMMGINA